MAGVNKSYDFSSIYMTQQDIKNSFRNLSMQTQRLRKSLYLSHGKFYAKMIKGKRETLGRELASHSQNFKTDKAPGKSTIYFDGAPKLSQTKSSKSQGEICRRSGGLPAKENTALRQINQTYGLAATTHKGDRELNEIEYLMKYKDELLEPTEKSLFVQKDSFPEERKIAKALCDRSNDLEAVKAHVFRKYMQDERIVDDCAEALLDLHAQNFNQRNPENKLQMQDMKELVKDSDKYLFVMFRNKEITVDQLKARLAEQHQGVRYKCLDDLRETLQPGIVEGTKDEVFFKIYKSEMKNGKRQVPLSELSKDLAPWQTNEHCLRSLFINKKKQVSQNLIRKKRLQSQNDQQAKNQLREQQKAQEIATQQKKSSLSMRKQVEYTRKGQAKLIDKTQFKKDERSFIKAVTAKIKSELKSELQNSKTRDRLSVLKEYMSSKKDLLIKEEKELAEERGVNPSPRKRALFQSDGVSHTLRNIKETLTQESAQIQNLMFLKQLETDGNSQVVWEQSTFNLMEQIEKEKIKHSQTDYKRELTKRKPRPYQIIQQSALSTIQAETRGNDLILIDENPSNQTMQFMSPFAAKKSYWAHEELKCKRDTSDQALLIPTTEYSSRQKLAQGYLSQSKQTLNNYNTTTNADSLTQDEGSLSNIHSENSLPAFQKTNRSQMQNKKVDIQQHQYSESQKVIYQFPSGKKKPARALLQYRNYSLSKPQTSEGAQRRQTASSLKKSKRVAQFIAENNSLLFLNSDPSKESFNDTGGAPSQKSRDQSHQSHSFGSSNMFQLASDYKTKAVINRLKCQQQDLFGASGERDFSQLIQFDSSHAEGGSREFSPAAEPSRMQNIEINLNAPLNWYPPPSRNEP